MAKRFLQILYTVYSLIIFLLIFPPLTILGYLLDPFLGRRVWHTLLKLLSRIQLRCMFVRILVKHPKNIPTTTSIFTSNQLSHIDGFILCAIIPQSLFAITEPIEKFHPIFRIWLRKLDFVDLRRTHKEDIQYPLSNTRKDGIKIAQKQLTKGMSLLIFPEGHFERNRKLLHFYPGAVKLAFTTGNPIVPIAIQGTHNVWKPDQLLLWPGRVTISFGRPLICNKTDNVSKKQINAKTILLKKKVAEMLPARFVDKGWEKNV
jgi:1-acyl-sn-glycerol-3-phosphate acyltransferase